MSKWNQYLAKKFWRSGRRKSVRLVTFLAISGVAIGVATLMLTQSVMSGMEQVFKEAILGFNAHLVVLKLDEMEDPEVEWEKLQGTLKGKIKPHTAMEQGIDAFQLQYLVDSPPLLEGPDGCNAALYGRDF